MAEKIIVDTDEHKSEWFGDANKPFIAIANMLVELDDKGLLPSSMRKAIHRHAENNIKTLPLTIASTAATMAAAATDFGLDKHDVANTAYGMQSLAEMMHGWTELFDNLGTEREGAHV